MSAAREAATEALLQVVGFEDPDELDRQQAGEAADAVLAAVTPALAAQAVLIVREAFKDYDERRAPTFTLLANVEAYLNDPESWTDPAAVTPC